MARRISKAEAVERIEALVEDIYEDLEEIRRTLQEAAPELLSAAESYWLAHVDAALLNRGGWLGKSMLTAQDTLEQLRRQAEEEAEGEE